MRDYANGRLLILLVPMLLAVLTGITHSQLAVTGSPGPGTVADGTAVTFSISGASPGTANVYVNFQGQASINGAIPYASYGPPPTYTQYPCTATIASGQSTGQATCTLGNEGFGYPVTFDYAAVEGSGSSQQVSGWLPYTINPGATNPVLEVNGVTTLMTINNNAVMGFNVFTSGPDPIIVIFSSTPNQFVSPRVVVAVCNGNADSTGNFACTTSFEWSTSGLPSTFYALAADDSSGLYSNPVVVSVNGAGSTYQGICSLYFAVTTVIYILAIMLLLLGGTIYAGSQVIPGQTRGQMQGYAFGFVLAGVIALIFAGVSPFIFQTLTGNTASSITGQCNSGGIFNGATGGGVLAPICNIYSVVSIDVFILAIALMILGGTVYAGSQILPGQTKGQLQGYAFALFLGGIIALIISQLAPFIISLVANLPAGGISAACSNGVTVSSSSVYTAICNIYTAVTTIVYILALALLLLGGTLYAGANVLPSQTRGVVQGYAFGFILGGLGGIIIASIAPYVLSLVTPAGAPAISTVCSANYNPTSGSTSPALQAICQVYSILNSVVFVLALALMIIGGALYAGANVLPGQTRGVVQGYAMGLVLGGLVGALIVLIAPWILQTIIGSSTFQTALSSCAIVY